MTLNVLNDRSCTRLCGAQTTFSRQRSLEERALVLGEVVLGERARAAGADVVVRVLLHPVEREDAVPRSREHRLVDVGRVDARAVVEALLGEQDRERVDLFAGRAAGDPDARERIGAQERHDLLAERAVERRVAEHRRDVDREVEQQALHHARVVQQPLEQAGDRLSALGVDAPPDPTPQRRTRVLPEVEAVLPVDAFEQQLELERLEIQPPLGRSCCGSPTCTATPASAREAGRCRPAS